MIEVRGRNGESIVLDGGFVSKLRHDGREETAKNPVTAYRQCDVKPKKRKRREADAATQPIYPLTHIYM